MWRRNERPMYMERCAVEAGEVRRATTLAGVDRGDLEDEAARARSRALAPVGQRDLRARRESSAHGCVRAAGDRLVERHLRLAGDLDRARRARAG